MSKIWVVIGGGDKGGIVVREGLDVSSALCTERLSTGALIKELDLQGERVSYYRLTGTGPETGWVSTKLQSGRDLLAPAEAVWEVVGGGDKGGIVVREGLDTASPLVPERLATGSLIRELEAEGERVHFERITGAGPVTGWVSMRLKEGRELIVRLLSTEWGAGLAAAVAAALEAQQPTEAPPSGTTGPPLEIRMHNPDKDFSYEGLPNWVPHSAAVARLKREGQPYLPTPDPPLARLSRMKPPGPFKKYPPKKLRELLAQNFPGAMFGLPFPRTAKQLESAEYGADWLTKALHAAGTLPEDNRVAKLVRVKELNMTGFQKEGGAAMKCFITVEYLKPDPSLHTELFAKYTWDPATAPPGINTLGIDDSLEVLVSVQLQHLFPFRSPAFYYADISRENTAYIIITEAIPYGKREEREFKPFEILPGLGKCQDHLLTTPVDFYVSIFNGMGQMGAWDKLGRFDGIFGPSPTFDEQTFLAFNQRQPQTKQTLESTLAVVGKTLDKEIDFLMTWCEKMAAPDVRNAETLQKVKAEIMEMAPYFGDMSGTYQNSNSDFIAANHANLQADNAFFWRDEYGDLGIGILDWGGFARTPFALRFTGCLSGADAEILLGHVEGIVQAYVDEYHRCGGPKVDLEEVLLRYHLCMVTGIYDLFRFVEEHVFHESPKEVFTSFSGLLDPRFQERFYTRCGCLPTINAYTYYIRKGNIKAMFDEWATGKGKPFLAAYT